MHEFRTIGWFSLTSEFGRESENQTGYGRDEEARHGGGSRDGREGTEESIGL